MINSILNKINYAQALKPVNFNKFAAKNISFGAKKDTFVKQNARLSTSKDEKGNTVITEDVIDSYFSWTKNCTVNRDLGWDKTIINPEGEIILRKEFRYVNGFEDYNLKIMDKKKNIISSEESRKIYDENGHNIGKNITITGKEGDVSSTRSLYDKYNNIVKSNTTVKNAQGIVISTEEYKAVYEYFDMVRSYTVKRNDESGKSSQIIVEKTSGNNKKTNTVTLDMFGNVLSIERTLSTPDDVHIKRKFSEFTPAGIGVMEEFANGKFVKEKKVKVPQKLLKLLAKVLIFKRGL